MGIKIPIYQPELTGNEKEYVIYCINSTWKSSKGKYVYQFEKFICSVCWSNTCCNRK